tara:strand:- start:1147 stop:1269 length:123 start_codon:yes stop_codon:yes gene_type:complete
MIEFIKHFFGFCGEPHLNIFHFIFTPAAGYLYYRIKKIKK